MSETAIQKYNHHFKKMTSAGTRGLGTLARDVNAIPMGLDTSNESTPRPHNAMTQQFTAASSVTVQNAEIAQTAIHG